MSTVLPFIIIGLTNGVIYALDAAGLVLTYRTSGVFNFALGAFGTLSSTLFYWLHVSHGVPWPIAAIVSVFGLGAVLGLILEPIGRAVAKAEVPFQVAATIGLVVSIEAVVTLWYGGSSIPFPAFLPRSPIEIGGVVVTVDQLVTIAVSLAVLGGLYVFLRVSRMGRLMRAVVDDPELVSMAASNPIRIRRWAWIIGTTLATLSGVLIAPTTSLDPELLTLLVVAGFAAAAIGAFSNLPWTFVGGLVVGLATSLAAKYSPENQWLAGLPSALPFLILFLALLVIRPPFLRRTEVGRRASRRYTAEWRAPGPAAIIGATLLLGFLVIVPAFGGRYLDTYSGGLAVAILFLSLGLLVRVSRQVVLCQYAFAAVGAATMGHLLAAGIPWGITLLLAGLIVVPVGAIVAIPAARLTGVFLGLATLGFALFIESMFYYTPIMFGTLDSTGLSIHRPSGVFGRSSVAFYYLLLAITGLAAAAVFALNRGRLGRLLVALGDAPEGLETAGVSLNTLRITVLCFCAFLAGLSGALAGSVNLYATAGSFDVVSSLTVFAVITFVVGQSPWYAFTCAFGYAVLPIFIPGNSTLYLQVAFGVTAIAHAYLRGVGRLPESAIPPVVRRAVDRLWGPAGRNGSGALESTATKRDQRSPGLMDGGSGVPVGEGRAAASRGRADAAQVTAPAAALLRDDVLTGGPPANGSDPAAENAGLIIRDLHVSFGGLQAVDGLSLAVRPGAITGLIGPNGAGKTTTFNACSGLVIPTAGEITLGGLRIEHLSPARRARLGLGRTFQHVQLYDSLNVVQNVALGYEARLAGGRQVSQIWSSRTERREIEKRSSAALQQCGLTEIADRPVAELPSGLRRLVELARLLAGGFNILLLDEPSSGLNSAETDAFADLLFEISSSADCGVLLVEHDVALVMRVCSYIYVMDFGRLIFEGTPAEVANSPAVLSAYLGSSVVTPVASQQEVW